LRRSRELKLMVRAHTLTADPSYERYLEVTESDSVQEGDRILVALQEIGGQHRQSWLEACIAKAGHWVVIARKGDISTEQTRALKQHWKLIGRVKPGHRKCLEKGWWKTRERKRVKGRYEHFVWERREREQDNGTGAEEAEETDGGPAGKAEEVDSEKFWDPYQAPSTQSLKTFLRALPSGQYYGMEKCMVATDGSLRLRRKKEEGETMGAGVAWHQDADMHREREIPPDGKGIHGTPREERGSRRQEEEEPQSVSRRVAGNLSSTRAELAAIAQAVKIAPIETDLIILIDSAAAIRRLTWFRRKDFRPHPRRTKDYDIVQEIVLSLDERGRHGARTTMVKVATWLFFVSARTLASRCENCSQVRRTTVTVGLVAK
jgi:hypothetical protein